MSPCYEPRNTASKDPGVKQKIDKYCRMLCVACSILEEHGLTEGLSKEAKEWWSAHKKFDKKRSKP